MLRTTRFIFLCAFLFSFSTNTAFASRVLFDTNYFKEIEELVILVHVTSKTDNSAISYQYNQEEVSSPLSREEIENAVISNFKSQFSDFDVEVFSRQDLMSEEKDIEEPEEFAQDSDPFASKPPPEKDRAEVHIYVVLKSYLTEKDGLLVYGAISSKILKGGNGGRFKVASNMDLEAFPQPFILPRIKEEAVEVIKEKTAAAFKMQRRWMLCKKHPEIKCYHDNLDNLKEK